MVISEVVLINQQGQGALSERLRSFSMQDLSSIRGDSGSPVPAPVTVRTGSKQSHPKPARSASEGTGSSGECQGYFQCCAGCNVTLLREVVPLAGTEGGGRCRQHIPEFEDTDMLLALLAVRRIKQDHRLMVTIPGWGYKQPPLAGGGRLQLRALLSLWVTGGERSRSGGEH
ncbi:hypothetical protein EK904_014458 [Melospiza melodia maxima]|nr:hypothetical protein EK904_014458 [Melospiza melodia maxima]